MNDDGTVTFRYKNDQAKEVFVDVQFAGKNAMKLDSVSGLWTATVGSVAPDLYPYSFQIQRIIRYFPYESPHAEKNGICIDADNFDNWPQRIEALEKALLSL